MRSHEMAISRYGSLYYYLVPIHGLAVTMIGGGGTKALLIVLPNFHAIPSGGLDYWIPDY